MVRATVWADALDPATQVLPVNGTREALFAFGQAVIDTSRANPAVVSPNPFYQIYEGAALLAGAEPLFLNQTDGNGFALDLDSLTERPVGADAAALRLLAGKPAGPVMTLDEWRALFERSDRYGFVIASDECYSEIYDDQRAARRARGRAATGPRRLPEPRGLHQPVEAIERAGAALGLRGRRCDSCSSSFCCIAPIMGAR